MLYEVAILEVPTKKDAEEAGAQEKLIFGPRAVVARDPQSAVLAAVLSDDGPKGVDLSKVQVVIRPFVQG